MPNIESFVFFDIETTGLPWEERNQTKITECSLVATTRKSLEATTYGGIPPVSKLTFVVNPERPIDPVVTRLTSLSNDLLQHSPVFKEKVRSLISFLEDLPKPVCLIAHNGERFDFKILLAELNDAGASLPEDIFCIDSLIGFRTLLKGSNLNYKDLEEKHRRESLVHKNEATDELLTDDDDEWPDLNVTIEEWDEIDDICLSLSDVSCEDANETERYTACRSKRKIKEERSKAISRVFKKKNVNTNNKSMTVVDNNNCYKLSALYKRLLNKEEINAHRAEVDCLILAECVVALKHDFVPWADESCKLLKDIKPLIRY